jgi:hypothetical protein
MTTRRKTLAGFLKLQIDVENTATPTEAITFIRSQSGISLALNPILKKLERQILETHEQPRNFIKQTISDNALLYSGPKNGADKSLLVCFCGRANRLFMPIAAFLQHFPEDSYDVLVLMDPAKLGFIAGIPGFARGFRNSLIKLNETIQFETYRELITFGTSGGGAAALYSAIFLGAQRGTSIGARHPSLFGPTRQRLQAEGYSGNEMEVLVNASLSTSRTALRNVYGELNLSDSRSARIFEQTLPNLRLIEIANTADHNSLKFFKNGSMLHDLICKHTPPAPY